MRLALLSTCLAALSACGIQLSQPDGGRLRLNCNTAPETVPVKVLDRLGNPAEAAIVVATNASDGRVQTGNTNSAGVFTISDDLGPGIVNVSASFNDLTTPRKVFTFTCGECECAVSPHQLTLQLQ